MLFSIGLKPVVSVGNYRSTFHLGKAFTVKFGDGKCNGRWEELHRLLREQVRQQEGREAQPTAGIIDN